MGKRTETKYERRERDAYDTPLKGVTPLLSHLPDGFEFVEPCAGKGELMKHLEAAGGKCIEAFDIEPGHPKVKKKNAFHYNKRVKRIITNPPWTREILHPMIDHFTRIAEETWLLFDADWAHTIQSSELIKRCEKKVSIGRLKWIPGTKHTGKDNCCWYLFRPYEVKTEFIGREIK